MSVVGERLWDFLSRQAGRRKVIKEQPWSSGRAGGLSSCGRENKSQHVSRRPFVPDWSCPAPLKRRRSYTNRLQHFRSSSRLEVFTVCLQGNLLCVLNMASKLHQKALSKDVKTHCEKMCVVLGSPVGRIEISGCKTGVHEISLQENAVPQNGHRRPERMFSNSHGRGERGLLDLGHKIALAPAERYRRGDDESSSTVDRKVCLTASTAETSVSCEVCEAPKEVTEPLKQCVAWLQAYFCEPWMTENLPIPPFHHPLLEKDSFTREVLWTLLRDVKFGEAVSYKQLADLAGNSKAARAVGGAMRSNPVPIIIPCHRVICSSGQTGNYTGGSHLKEWLLSHEKLQKKKLAY
ncbi:methylated-DNA--protein-cysteine methyltransferase isoform X2 [Rhineura floridana]|uniref:methylated-DNA--protein-cysteine methyltransferase isoform X2 n=1 Tax=Rhineura floridana TaxID=261503 RepID=UPI002AC87A0C|nr:methylated-DNA--protein-cysteine methyltransferase isoform X2 [Rhineura floridana]